MAAEIEDCIDNFFLFHIFGLYVPAAVIVDGYWPIFLPNRQFANIPAVNAEFGSFCIDFCLKA